MDNYYFGGYPYDPYSPYLVSDNYNPEETQEEREQRSFTGLLCVLICYIGFPMAVAMGYGLYRLAHWLHCNYSSLVAIF